MRNGIEAHNLLDENGNPTGGYVTGTGIDLRWQDGPLGRDGERREPNGAFVEDVIEGVRQRLQFFQEASDGRFACAENALAIEGLTQALDAFDARTKRREVAAIEGTHAPEGERRGTLFHIPSRLKLDVLCLPSDYRESWEPEVGDLYTIDRPDNELFEIVSIKDGVTVVRNLTSGGTIQFGPDPTFDRMEFHRERIPVKREWLQR